MVFYRVEGNYIEQEFWKSDVLMMTGHLFLSFYFFLSLKTILQKKKKKKIKIRELKLMQLS